MIELNKIYFEDGYDTLGRVEDGKVDFMLQDTPFGVTQNEWDVAPDFEKMWPEWLRCGKDNCAFLFFATQPFACDLINSNRKMFRYDLIWYKRLGSGFLNANKMPMRNHEHILVFYRALPTYNPQKGTGNRKKFNRKHDRNGTNYGRFATEGTVQPYDDNGKRHPQSIIDISNGDRQNENEHPTQKPEDLFRYLIRTYTNEDDLVFDGYAGSGTTAAACLEENRNFIVSETNKEYFNVAEKRIASILRAPKLFP